MNDEYYVCPEHNDVILFENSDNKTLKLMTVSSIDSPKECPKCSKSYYKWECKLRKPGSHDD